MNTWNTWYLVNKPDGKYKAFVFQFKQPALRYAKRLKTKVIQFSTKDDAIAYTGLKRSKIQVIAQETEEVNDRVCLLCERPFKGKTMLCHLCNSKKNRYGNTMFHGKPVSIGAMIYAKEHNCSIACAYNETTKQQRADIRKSRARYLGQTYAM